MKFDSRQKRILIVCVAAAFLLPLISVNDEKGGYVTEVLRLLIVGLAVAAVVPRIERWRKRSEAEKSANVPASGAAETGTEVIPPNAPGAKAVGPARKAGTQEVVMLSLSRGDAFARALGAVKGLKRASVTVADAEAGQISAKIGPSLRSVGEVIDVKVADGDNGRVRVEVYSKARVTMTSSDRDKAEDNVLEIVRILKGHV